MRRTAPPRIAGSLALLASLAFAPAAAPVPDEAEPSPLLRSLLDAHNKERAAEELPPLTLDPKLTEAAQAHAADMAGRGEMSHEGGDGSTPAGRVKRAGYHYLRTAENVAAGQPDVASVVAAWMDSPGHRKNILGDFAQMGAAKVEDGEGRPYWSVSFGTPIPRLDPDAAESDALTKINAAREEAGKGPIRLDPKLAAIARKFAEEAARDAAKPDDEKKPTDLGAAMKEAGVAFSNLTQSVATGEPTAESYVATMLRNEEQKESLLGPFESAGIGYARDAEDRPFWCLLLVEP